ncbi:similar to hypothetical protein DKFZp434P0316 (predicted), isoform CRA_a [Rattus norvegicus]|uniref:DUF4795 domain-containing protein n=1 Tax=Rattus norvegicus TaxID=10116 RepID=A6HKW4_RAT|nr:similar to hypothetical protein DKFZp434P0316 (predicted), isoform CRA_a [Rattus norvegicus]
MFSRAADQTLESTGGPAHIGGVGPDMAFSRDQSRSTLTFRDMARESFQVSSETDSQMHARRDEQLPGQTQQDRYQRGGMPGMEPLGMDQAGSTHPVVPLTMGQLGVMPPEMHDQRAEPPYQVQSGVQPSGADREPETLSPAQLGTALPLSAPQQGMMLPGPDQQGMEQAAVYGSGQGPWATAQQGLTPVSIDLQGLPIQGTGQQGPIAHQVDGQGLVMPGQDQRAVPPSLPDQRRLASLGLTQKSTDQQDFRQSSLASRFVQPGSEQPGVEQRDVERPGLDRRSSMPVRTERRTSLQTAADRRLSVPIEAERLSLAQSRAGQEDSVQPEAGQYGLVQPRADQYDFVQPGDSQLGLMQPGVGQAVWLQSRMSRDLVQPGTDESDLAQPEAITVEVQSEQADLRYPDQARRVEADTQVTWDLRSKPASAVQLGPTVQTTKEQVTPDSRTQDSWSYLQTPSVSETRRERQESLEKLAPSFPMAVETFRLIGEIVALYVELKEQLKDLDEEQAGQTDWEKIQYLIARLAKVSGQWWDQPFFEHCRVTVSDIEKELAELRESQDRGKAAMENSVSEASLYLQDQLDKLRTIIESMLSSSSALLSLSITPHKSLGTLVPGQIDPEATCPACSLDVSHQVSLLVQRYEQLQDMVTGLAASRPSKKAKLQGQDEELLGHVQSAILQVQGDCEKLNITTSNLIEDHRQKQKDIEKADKSALASKVSRIQFDATTEQLNHMMQELVAKMSGQEQDWQKLLDKLLAEMDSKLDRLELDPLKQTLEDRWKSLRQQLKERSPLYQADEAAAMRRQLLAHFHCLSCDRPLETTVTGQVLSMTPIIPSMPGHRSVRPYTVFELEQIRQQSRNLKLGSSFPRGDLSQMEKSVGRLRSMHSKMLMDIEKVQIHFGGSVKASSQMIRELLHSQCLSHPCYKRGADTTDYTYSTVPRRCGGSHTLTYPYRRNRPQHLSPLEEIQIAMKHDEVDILGLDGHIYKGRMDTRLPGILGKDAAPADAPDAAAAAAPACPAPRAQAAKHGQPRHAALSASECTDVS